ncbi:hypothetical protein ACIPPJ_30115 [Streptomyces sp. NPDC086091]|uniref:hypothetical protein n=1 Tax=Streptomyces sp. NPDC086091 TaxID=3365751 RepID=UPI0037FD5750
MDYDTGVVRYCLASMVKRLGLSRATISRHVAYLREMGSLVWVERGSRANVRRALGLDGYAATATLYAAVIPASYDLALGHTVVGSGYTARMVVDLRERGGDSAASVPAVDNWPVDIPCSVGRETPSLLVVTEVGQVQMGGGVDASTEQARTADPSPRRKKRTLTILGYKITADRIERARKLAVAVRPLVNWTQGATHDQLSWVMLDMVAEDWSRTQVLVWLRDLGQQLGVGRWRPRFPHRVIAAALRRRDQARTEEAATRGPDYDEALRQAVPPSQTFQEAARRVRDRSAARESYEEYAQVEEVPADAWELALLREAAAADPELVLAAAQLAGREAAVQVYGTAGARILDLHAEFRAAGLTCPSPSDTGTRQRY